MFFISFSKFVLDYSVFWNAFDESTSSLFEELLESSFLSMSSSSSMSSSLAWITASSSKSFRDDGFDYVDWDLNICCCYLSFSHW